MIDLNKEAEEYVRNESDNTLKLISKYSFKDGANSNYVKQQILQAQIDLLNTITYNCYSRDTQIEINVLLKPIQQELKQLQDE